MNDASIHRGHDSPRASRVEAAVRLLNELGATLGVTIDPGAAREAIRECARPELESTAPEPLEALQRAASRSDLLLVPQRMRVADMAWLADSSLPIVAWSEAGREWIAVYRHGFFRARVWRGSRPEEGTSSISRSELASLLGARGANDLVDAGIVQMRGSAEPVSSHAAKDGHAHGAMSPLRRAVALMRPEMPELWTIVAFSAITGLLYLALPLAVNAFISNISFGVASGPFVQALAVTAVVLLICLAVAAALRGLQQVVAEVIQRRIFVRLGSDLAYRLPNVDLEAIDGVHAPELVNRFLDVITVQKSASMLLLTGINLVLSAAIGLAVLAFYHPYLLAYSLALLAALAFIVFVVGRRAVHTSIGESKKKYDVVGWLEEIARHPRVFKGPGGEALALSRADDLLRGYLGARGDHFRILMRQISGLLVLEVVAATALLALGGWLVLSQQLTVGQLVASEIILSSIVVSISKLGKQFEAWYDAVAAVEKLGHLIDLPLERKGGESVEADGDGACVEARSIAYARLGRKPAFEGLSFRIEPGERVALLGSRGMGTSSVLELLLGMRQPQHGEIAIDGLDVRSWDLAALRARCCILRSTDVIAGTVAENIRLGLPDISGAELQRAVDDSGLSETLRTLPDGLATRLTTGGLPLTGRQRARLLAARALAAKPRLLLLDEVLDGHEGTLDALARVLIDAPHPWTVIVATRDPRVAARCSRTIELVPAGEVVRHG